jgi:hypothetical protein
VNPVPRVHRSSTEVAPPANRRERRVYVLWGVGLGLLALIGIFSWMAVMPCLEVRSVLEQVVEQRVSAQGAVRQLGGPRNALPKLRLYVRLPLGLVPNRSNVPDLLSRCGPPAIDTLTHMLYNDTKDVSWAAADALADIGEPAIPALAEALHAEGDHVRAFAACALGEMGLRGLGGRAAEEPLLEAAKDPDPAVRSAAAEALKKMRGGQAGK